MRNSAIQFVKNAIKSCRTSSIHRHEYVILKRSQHRVTPSVNRRAVGTVKIQEPVMFRDTIQVSFRFLLSNKQLKKLVAERTAYLPFNAVGNLPGQKHNFILAEPSGRPFPEPARALNVCQIRQHGPGFLQIPVQFVAPLKVMADVASGALSHIIGQKRPIGRMGTGINDFFRPLHGTQSPQIRQALFRDHDLHGMFVVVHVRHHGYHR